MENIEQKLKAKFPQDELKSRILRSGLNQKTGKIWAEIALYVDARQIQDRLDEVVGFANWKTEYTTSDKGVVCNLILKINGEWIGKQNGSDYSDIEAFKGGISGALVRAGVDWGIGRYLYDCKNIYAEISDTKKDGWNYAKDKKSDKEFYWRVPKLPDHFLPEVKKVETPKVEKIKPETLEIISEMITEAINLGFTPKAKSQNIESWTEKQAGEYIGKLQVKITQLKKDKGLLKTTI